MLLWKLDRDGSGSITINELLDSSDDEDNGAVFRNTALAPVMSREDLKVSPPFGSSEFCSIKSPPSNLL
jgi:hypothetical protein